MKTTHKSFVESIDDKQHKQATLNGSAHEQCTSKLMRILDRLKDSKIADEEHEMRILNLCGAIKTINSCIIEWVEFEEKELNRTKERGIEYNGVGLDRIRNLSFQSTELVKIIDEMAGAYWDVSEIFYHYKEECGKLDD